MTIKPRLQRRHALALLGTAPLALGLRSAAAQPDSYPSRPVRVISPFPAGGSGDIITRYYSAKLSESLGQQFVVENRPGANGMIGMSQAARAAPDGYTLVHSYDGSFSVAPAMGPTPVEPLRDFTPLGMMGQLSFLLIATESWPHRTLKDTMAEIRRKGEEITYASAGIGSSLHILMEIFLKQMGGKATMVPFSGTAPGVNAVLGGHVQLMLCGIPTALPHIRSGKLKAIAFAAQQRHPTLPDLPTFKEAGFDYRAQVWQGLFGPAGLPDAITRKLAAECWKVSKSDDFAEKFIRVAGYDSAMVPPEEFPAFLREDRKRYEDAIASLGPGAKQK
ncbi:MAG: Bug family tripartite tricarboxylate transporter substrate binding protein [Burkholderiaceae bacterium]